MEFETLTKSSSPSNLILVFNLPDFIKFNDVSIFDIRICVFRATTIITKEIKIREKIAEKNWRPLPRHKSIIGKY